MAHGGGSPMDHLMDEFDLKAEHAFNFFGIPLPHLQLGGIDISVNKAVVVMWLAAILTVALVSYAGRGRGLVAGGIRNAIEAIFVFLKADIVESSFGKDAKKWMPYIGGLFFFILFSNLLGLIPNSFAPMSNLNVTATLALITFALVVIQGLTKQGPIKYWINLAPSGLPKVMYVIMYPIEFVSLLAKPLSLALRLFANLFAGHLVIFSLCSLVLFFNNWIITPLPIAFAAIIFMFEIFVAFIQAYLFAVLSALYISAAIHPDH
jgi:F-type H+-transporting ATPase subunit a